MVNLRIPGPTPCPPDVLQAGAQPMVNHRGPEFKTLIHRVTKNLKTFFQTQNDLLILTTSGTGGMEAAVVNTLSPGDGVLAVTIGSFGDRFASIAKAYGAQVKRLEFPWGQAADPQAIRNALQEDPSITTVLVTHNETSTGVTNPLEEIARVVKGFDKLLLVDAVSSIGSIPLPVDKWGCDVVVTGSQKGWMTPPGLAMISFSQRAWEASAKAKMPRFYFDLSRAKKSLEVGETPWTPAVSIYFSLDLALEKMIKEGLDAVFQRHARVGQLTRQGLKALGLSILADERVASNTVTAVKSPPGVDVKALIKILGAEHKVVVAGGQGKLEGQIFRVGHLGLVDERDIKGVLDALKAALPKVGFKPTEVTA